MDVPGLLADYRSLALELAEGEEPIPAADRPFKVSAGMYRQNRTSKKLGATWRQLRLSPEGRKGLDALMDDPDPGVRVQAAFDCRSWEPKRAEEVLKTVSSTADDATSARAARLLASMASGH